jgi:hypothetical protein
MAQERMRIEDNQKCFLKSVSAACGLKHDKRCVVYEFVNLEGNTITVALSPEEGMGIIEGTARAITWHVKDEEKKLTSHEDN